MKQKPILSLRLAMLPIVALVLLLSLNVSVYGDDALGGSNQFILLLGGAVAAMVGFAQKISYKDMLQQVAENLKSVTSAILILLFVGALAGTWLVSGIIPAMIYYGLQILHPTFFLAACIIICALISCGYGQQLDHFSHRGHSTHWHWKSDGFTRRHDCWRGYIWGLFWR